MNKADTSAYLSQIESVWEYPRPPRLEPVPARIRVVHAGETLADSARALRILETSHPPVYYLPQTDIAMARLRRSPARSSYCEFKGAASYWSLVTTAPDGSTALRPDVAWSYERPSAPYAALKDHLAFYASRVDECWVDGERVVPQEGDFYGGWITSNLRGPFKGAPGTRGW
jgi:uncharacterized protein (DUF427 family)